MKRNITKTVLLSTLLAGPAAVAQTPVFTTPVASEYIYSDPHVREAHGTSAYSATQIQTGFGQADMYVASWYPKTGAQSEVTWQLLQVGTTSVLQQGSIPYFGVAGIDVSAVFDGNTGQTQILVAYYRFGSGHFVDVYDVTNSTTTPVVFNHTVQLSNASDFGRIRVDGFYQHQMVFIWEHPGIGIQSCALDNFGNWGMTQTFPGTEYQHEPDVALKHGGNANPARIHYVYHNGDGVVTESTLDWGVLMNATSGTLSPLVEDVIVLNHTISNPVIDCPDLCEKDNWAYTYSDNRYVYVRFMDYFTTATPTSIAVTSGALGNAPLNAHETYSPTLHYGMTDAYGIHPTDNITVAWYVTDLMGTNGYAALQMTADGNTLLSGPDYMALPNSFTPNQYYGLAGIALSKSDPQLAPEFLYASYFDYDPAADQYNLHHAYHQWGNTVFKGTKELNIATNTYPNPFYNLVNTAVTVDGAAMIHVQLFDINGRIVSHKKQVVPAGTHQLQLEQLQNLAPGAYFLNTSVNGKAQGIQQLIKL